VTGLIPLFEAAALTIVVEVAFLTAIGYRTRLFVTVCALVNLGSNLTLNLCLSFVPAVSYAPAVAVGEVAVVIIEWLVLRLALPNASRPRASVRLLGFVFLANLASFTLGLLIV
jgi:hypothetical protein